MVKSTDGANQISERIRKLRKERRMTLKDASRRSGVSISALSKIENSLISPSFDILKKICIGLTIPIEDIVRSNDEPATSGRKTVTLLGEGARFSSGQYEYVAHSSELSRKAMVPLEIAVLARSVDQFDHWSQHNGEEFVFVLSGIIEIHTSMYAPFRLAAGESSYFDSGMAHVYISVSPDAARVLSVSHDPRQYFALRSPDRDSRQRHTTWLQP